MKRVYEFLKKCGTYYLATVDGGKPRVRPFGTIDIFEGKLYFQTSKEKNVSKQLHKNPCFEISAVEGGENWLRLEAEAVEDGRIEPKKQMLDAYPQLKAMYSAEDANTEVFYLKNATATFYSLTGEPEVVKF